ncbi:MAG: aminotransferase class III-fold pyridoxal phosphate-dependent enzyme, partial [Clostridium sp.]
LDILEEGSLVESLKDKGEYLSSLINREFKYNKYVGEIRSIGLINAIEIVKDRDSKEGFNSDIRLGYQIYKHALSMGLLLRPLGNVIYFNPPLTITYEEIEESVKICKEAFNIIDKITNQ